MAASAMSYLTQPIGELEQAVIAGLADEGFTYHPLTETFSQLLARALGRPTDYLWKSDEQMLEELTIAFGGAADNLRMSFAQLLDVLAAQMSAGSGGGGGDDGDEDMPLISSGAISSPASYFDLELPTGYTLFTLELVDFLFSGSNSQPTLTCIFSPDGGSNWYNNTDDFNSYSHSGLSEDVSTAISVEGQDSVANLAANGASKDIYLNGTIKIWPGATGTKAMVRSDLCFNSGDPFTWNSMTARLETTGRQNRIRFSFGDDILTPPNGNNEWTAGTYLLFGVPTP
jgi:hypothetical protein